MISILTSTSAFAQDENAKVDTKKQPAASLTKQRFVSPYGYTLVPPNSWAGYSRHVSDKTVEGLEPQLQDRLEVDNIDIIFISMMPNGKDFKYENNIVIARIPLRLRFDKVNLGKFREHVLDAQFSKFYKSYEIINYSVIKLGGRDVINVDMKASTESLTLYQRQIYVPLGSTAIMVNCATSEAATEPVRAVCEAVAASVKPL
jgi:hypothetical protein